MTMQKDMLIYIKTFQSFIQSNTVT